MSSKIYVLFVIKNVIIINLNSGIKEEQKFLEEEIKKRVPCILNFEQANIFIDFSILGIKEFQTKMILGIEYFEENDLTKER